MVKIKFLSKEEMARAKDLDPRYELVGIKTLGFADKFKKRIFVRSELGLDLKVKVIDHELDHLSEPVPTHEDSHGIRHWGDYGGIGQNSTTDTTNKIVQLPDYPEATGARENWWSTLQKWQTQPGYGAIQPDWNSIWENARGKVSRYFGGGPEGPGVNATVKAGLARRGMAENPASDALLQRSGFQQGNMLQDLAVQQATKEAELGEKGRTDWLSSLMQLAGLKPQFTSGGSTVTKTYEPQQASTTDYLGMASDLFGSSTDSMDILKLTQLMSGTSAQGGGDTGIGDVYGGGGGGLFGYLNGEDSGDVWSDPQTYQQIIQIAAMFCHVAAEVFNGWSDERTCYARYYISEVGPKWFKKWYGKNCKRIAAFIHDKPLLKTVIRPVFSYFAWRGKIEIQNESLHTRTNFMALAPKIIPEVNYGV